MLRVRPLSLVRTRSVSHFHATHICCAARKVLKRFNLADIGEGITECEVIKWNVKPMNTVQAFDPLCEVQSDKASVEITSPFDGLVKELLVKEGDVAKVGEALCMIEVDEHAPDTDTATDPESIPATEQPSHPSTGVSAPPDMSNVSGSKDSRTFSKRNPHPLDPNLPQGSALSATADLLATPSVRHFARLNGIDLAKLHPGSGRDGRIEKKDVEAYMTGTVSTEKKFSSPVSTQAMSNPDIVVELGRTRYGMWKAMEKSLDIPQFGFTTSLDLTRLHDLMPILNDHIPTAFLPAVDSPSAYSIISPSSFYENPNPQPPVSQHARYSRLTYLSIFLKTLSKAMLEWPLLRSSLTLSPPGIPLTGRPSLTIRPHCDISIALSTPTGLYTPTIQSVESQSIYSLASKIKHFGYLGRQVPCALTPADMPKRGGTISISNVGGVGQVESASPVLVPGGGVAIVAIGRAKWIWDVDRGDGTGQRRLKIGVSWSADHRIVEGAELIAFVEAWRSWIEAPERLIADCA